MQELADWLAMPQNEKEFLIVFFDDQMDLASWVSKDGLYLLSMLQLWWRLLSTPTLLPMLAPWYHVPLLAPKKAYLTHFPSCRQAGHAHYNRRWYASHACLDVHLHEPMSLLSVCTSHSKHLPQLSMLNLLWQDMVPVLLNLTLSVFPIDTIFTPPELLLTGGVWPSMDELVARGKRVMFVSGADYGLAMNTVIFTK